MNNAWTKLTVILLGLPSKLFSQFFSRHERFAPEFGTFPMVNRINIPIPIEFAMWNNRKCKKLVSPARRMHVVLN